ncbi:MAG: hypothetical protein LLG05_18825 [Porphyromonadaceae bacterium]|nr:hypothetical protein [Porphyromonadaceae bacterium]
MTVNYEITKDEEIMKKVHKEYPHSENYPFECGKGHSCYDDYFEVYCDSDTDIVRCRKCGNEWAKRCTFDDDFC